MSSSVICTDPAVVRRAAPFFGPLGHRSDPTRLRNFDSQQNVVGADAYLDNNSARRSSSLVCLDDFSADKARLDSQISRSASSQGVRGGTFVMLDDLNADRVRVASRLDDSQASQSSQETVIISRV